MCLMLGTVSGVTCTAIFTVLDYSIPILPSIVIFVLVPPNSQTPVISYMVQHLLKVKVLHLYTAFFYLSFKGWFTTLTPSRELTQPWCESSPWGDWISEQPTSVLNAVLPYVCWYSFYLPTEGWRAESTPSQVGSGVGIEPGTCHVMVHCSTNWAIMARSAPPFVLSATPHSKPKLIFGQWWPSWCFWAL